MRSARERGLERASALESLASPKSSRLLLLRRRLDGLYFVCVAVHFESGKPSDTQKVCRLSECFWWLLVASGGFWLASGGV